MTTPGTRRCDDLVQLAEERDRLEVLAAAVVVRHPLARLARVVEVEHRGDRVHAQAVGVEVLEPVERAREQEVPHLGAAVVEDQRAPVGMRAPPRVGVLVERGAVEAGERELVAREVGRHPVEDHADARARAAGRRSARKSSGAPKRAVGREEARHLVAPRAAERVLHHRHQLDVREAHLDDVVAELVGELQVRQRAVALERIPAARSRDGPRRSTSARPRAAPGRGGGATRRPARRAAERKTTEPVAGGSSVAGRDGVGLEAQRPVLRRGSRTCRSRLVEPGQEELPDPGRAEAPQWVGREYRGIQHNMKSPTSSTGACVRRPHREGDPGDLVQPCGGVTSRGRARAVRARAPHEGAIYK